MKKSILLIAAGMMALGANAKVAKNTVKTAAQNKTAGREAYVPGSVPATLTPEVIQAAKATNTVIGTVETFATGNATQPAANWVANPPVNTAKWKWMNAGADFIPDLNSPTGANGWAAIDPINNATSATEASMNNTVPFVTTGHSHVGLVFNSWAKKFRDSAEIDVASNNMFTGATHFQVYRNNSIGNNEETRNTDTVVIDLGAAGSNQATLYIRFHYYGQTNGYGWAVDDVRLVDLDALNVKSQGATVMYSTDASNHAQGIGTMPRQFILGDSVGLIDFVFNQGYNAQASYSVGATMNTVPAYNQSASITNLAVNGYDSAVEFPFNHAVPGSGDDVYTVNLTGTGGLSETKKFGLSDSAWANFSPDNVAVGGYYLHRPSTDPNGEFSWNWGTILTVPAGKADTISSFQAVFASSSTVGSRVMFQVYHFTSIPNPHWELAGLSWGRALTANDTSATGGPYTYSDPFFPNSVYNNGPLVITGDPTAAAFYAVVATSDHTPATSKTVLLAAEVPQYQEFFGGVGLYDSSDNGRAAGFGDQNYPSQTFAVNLDETSSGNNLPWSFELAPMIVTNFSTYQSYQTKVANTGGFIASNKVYPNPANNMVTVTFSANENVNASVSIQNAIGQVIKTLNVGQVLAGQNGNASFNTTGLANGVYFYTINANGQNKTGRFVIAH